MRRAFLIVLTAACGESDCIDDICPDVANTRKFAGPCAYAGPEHDTKAAFTYDAAGHVTKIVENLTIRGENGTSAIRDESSWTYDANGELQSIIAVAVCRGHPTIRIPRDSRRAGPSTRRA